ncbi:MAG: ribonuclease E/G [Lachnospirales bacterium]
MSENILNKLLIDSYTNKTKICLMEKGELTRLLITDKTNPSIVGNLYIGYVTKIVNKQFCFVDIGGGQTCFLDMRDSKEQLFKHENIHQSSRILVEITKDKTAEKVPRATTEIGFSNKGFMKIFKSYNNNFDVRISKAISGKEERLRLKEIGEKILTAHYSEGEGGYTILFRTIAKGVSFEDASSEYLDLVKMANDVFKRASAIKPPYLLLDNAITKQVFDFVKEFDTKDIKVITNDLNIFDTLENSLFNIDLCYENDLIVDYGVDLKINKHFNKKVWLKSGGFLYFEETETAVLIDVNSGKLTGLKNQEKAILKTNLDAVNIIFKEMKMRNLSGIILIDLINMVDSDNLKILLDEVRRLARLDYQKVSVQGLTKLFILEITRKKEQSSLISSNFVTCDTCNGKGYVEDDNFICDKIFRELYWFAKNTNKKHITVETSEKIINRFNNSNAFLIDDLLSNFGVAVSFKKVYHKAYNYFKLV